LYHFCKKKSHTFSSPEGCEVTKKFKFSNGEKSQIFEESLQKYFQKIWNFRKNFMFCLNFERIGLKRYYFLQGQKSPNDQTILEDCIKKGFFREATKHVLHIY
jgi:hypothetical protein